MNYVIERARVGDLIVERAGEKWRVYAVGNVVELDTFDAALDFAHAQLRGRSGFGPDVETPTRRRRP